jgi:Transposase DDE domain group 1
MTRPVERVVAFYNKRGTCEQWIKKGKGAIKWTRLSCRTFAANAVRLQLHSLAYNLGNFLRTLATPEPINDWSLTHLKDKLIKIGAKVVSHGLYVCFSNRPFGVKHFQTIHLCGVDVARGLALLFGIGTKALPSWDSKMRWNNFSGGLAVG